MTTLRSTPRPFSRFALLLAALLHLLGAAAGPALHARVAERPLAAEQRRGDERERPRPPAHDERGCAVCQAHASAAVPPDGHTFAVATSEAREAFGGAPRLLSLRAADAPRARGPPVLS